MRSSPGRNNKNTSRTIADVERSAWRQFATIYGHLASEEKPGSVQCPNIYDMAEIHNVLLQTEI
jgi:hypothetical protein